MMNPLKIAKKMGRLYFTDKNIGIRESAPGEIMPFPQPKEGAVKLNIGGGKGHPRTEGWRVIDLRESSDIIMDITKENLPFRDGSVDVIFASHILEHINQQNLDSVLAEFYRVLRPKRGLLRVSVPDIEKAIAAYLKKDYLFFARSSIAPYDESMPLGGMLASWFYSTRLFGDPQLKYGDGHLHCFDKSYLAWYLKKANFRFVWVSGYRGSVIDELREEGMDLHKNDSLYMEAVK